MNGLTKNNIEVKDVHPIQIDPNEYNIDYLKVKKEKMQHQLHIFLSKIEGELMMITTNSTSMGRPTIVSPLDRKNVNKGSKGPIATYCFSGCFRQNKQDE